MTNAGPFVQSLKRAAEAAEARVRALKERVRKAEHRAEVAERAAREAWAFARMMRTAPYRPSTLIEDCRTGSDVPLVNAQPGAAPDSAAVG